MNAYKLWYISITPEFRDHEKIKALKFRGKADLIYCFLEIALYSAEQPIPYYIVHFPDFSSIHQQLSVLLGWPQPIIEETFSEFVPIGWIVFVENSINVPVARALTTNKTLGALKKSIQRGRNLSIQTTEQANLGEVKQEFGQMSTHIKEEIVNIKDDQKILNNTIKGFDEPFEAIMFFREKYCERDILEGFSRLQFVKRQIKVKDEVKYLSIILENLKKERAKNA